MTLNGVMTVLMQGRRHGSEIGAILLSSFLPLPFPFLPPLPFVPSPSLYLTFLPSPFSFPFFSLPRGPTPPLNQLGGLENAVSSHSGVWGDKRFGAYLSRKEKLWWQHFCEFSSEEKCTKTCTMLCVTAMCNIRVLIQITQFTLILFSNE